MNPCFPLEHICCMNVSQDISRGSSLSPANKTQPGRVLKISVYENNVKLLQILRMAWYMYTQAFSLDPVLIILVIKDTASLVPPLLYVSSLIKVLIGILRHLFVSGFLVRYPQAFPMEISSVQPEKTFIMEWWLPTAATLMREGRRSLTWWVSPPYTVPATMVKLESGAALLLSALNSTNVLLLPMLKMQSCCLRTEACFP